ncbi:MAG: DUF2834 domain-containing protein [Cyanobacteria bacterium P01_A01_bin.116]
MTPTAPQDSPSTQLAANAALRSKIGFALLWLGFGIYAFAFAPPAQPDTLDTIIQLSSGQWDALNPAIVALFNLMGIWPMIYASLALIDGLDQKIPAWPFVAGSFAVGAFALLPYLALRQPTPAVLGSANGLKSNLSGHKLIRLVDSPWFGRSLLLGSVLLLSYGVFNGDWSDFAEQWRTSQFIHVMSLDFCMLCAVVGPLLKSDMAKRTLNNPVLFWSATLIPLLGIAFYLSVRSPLSTLEETPETA